MFAGTVAENLRIMDQEASDEALWRVLDLACAGDFVRKLPQGLNTELKEGGGSLSSGQAQRLSIARALLADAPVLCSWTRQPAPWMWPRNGRCCEMSSGRRRTKPSLSPHTAPVSSASATGFTKLQTARSGP